MASVGVAPTSSGHTVGVDRLPEEMNDMKIRDDKVNLAKAQVLKTNITSNKYFSHFCS